MNVNVKSPSYKAALLSGFVFPGMGYLSLKMYRRAALTIIPAMICFAGLVQLSILKAQALTDLLIEGKVAPDMVSMLEAMKGISDMSAGWQDYAGYGFMLLWGLSVLDAFLIAKKSVHP